MRFRERLSVPVSWWVLAVVLAVALLASFGFYLGPVWGVSVAVVAMAVAVAVFASAAITITVDEHELRVGRSVIEHKYLGPTTSLDADQAARRGGVEADARAHLVLRPYIRTAVEVALDDPADRVPYWLVSTRRPAELTAALTAAGATGRPE